METEREVCPRLRPKEVEQILETHCQPRPPKGTIVSERRRDLSLSDRRVFQKKYERWWTDTLKLSVHFFQNVLRKVRFERTIKEENAWRKTKAWISWGKKALSKKKTSRSEITRYFKEKKSSTRKCFSNVAYYTVKYCTTVKDVFLISPFHKGWRSAFPEFVTPSILL